MGWDVGHLNFGLPLVLLAELQRWVQLGTSSLSPEIPVGLGMSGQPSLLVVLHRSARGW